jgi:hypothetical protein
MSIEDRIAKLEEIVQAMHGKLGHKWYRGGNHIDKLRNRFIGYRQCECGAVERCESVEQYDALPHQYQLDERI